MDYYQLNFVSLTAVTIAFFVATILPSVSSSIYFHRNHYASDQNQTEYDNIVEVSGSVPGGSSTTDLQHDSTVRLHQQKKLSPSRVS